eukprot:EG_transcript_789
MPTPPAPGRVEAMLWSYQLELYHQAKDENTIVFCPTGAGKTMVALAVAEHVLLDRPPRPKERLKDNSSKNMVLFLSDRVSLLEQQFDAFERSEHIRADIVHAESKSRGWDRIFSKNNTLFIMASIFLRELEMREVDITEFDLIILDECHHCFYKHPFNQLFTYFFNKAPMERRPQVFGMTASPGARPSLQGTAETIQQLCVNMWCKIIMVCQETAELQRRAPLPSTTRKVIGLCSSEQEFERTLQLQMGCVEEFIRSLPDSLDAGSQVKRFLNTSACSMGGQNVQKMEKHSPQYYLLMERQATFAKSERRYGLARLFQCLHYFSKALVYLSEVGTESASQYVEERQRLLEESVAKDQYVEETSAVQRLKQTESQLCDREFAETFSDLWAGTHHIPLSHTNDKTEYILDLLASQAAYAAQDITTEASNGFQAIVFVQTKRGAKRLQQLVSEQKAAGHPRGASLADVRPAVFVGHSSSLGEDRGTLKGMTVAKQKEVLAAFRKGECNVLFATNVAEEGLDVPACNLVVRYDVSFSLTSMIQSRGRARKLGGQFVVLLPARDEGKYDELVAAEENMKTVVAGQCIDVNRVLREQLPWYSLSPEKLLEQYVTDFAARKGEGRVVPHYVNAETTLRSGRTGWFSGVQVPVTEPTGEEGTIFASGFGESPGFAEQQAAIRACGRLDDLGVLKYLRKDAGRGREFTQFTSLDTAVTNSADDEGEAIQVFDAKLWGSAQKPFDFLVEWCMRGNAIGPPDCEWQILRGGMYQCVITLQERVLNPELGQPSVQAVPYQSPYSCETADGARETTALFVLGKKKRWFHKKAPPKTHQRRMLQQDPLPQECMEVMAVYKLRKRRAEATGFKLSFVPVASAQQG